MEKALPICHPTGMLFVVPYRDQYRAWGRPLVNYGLVGLCCAVYVFQQVSGFDWFGSGSGEIVGRLAVIPAQVSRLQPQALGTLITYQFLHGNILHLLLNLFPLWVFGKDVEDRMGHFQYLGFFLLCGVGGGLLHVLFSFNSETPMLGASGSIMGVMAAHMILLPQVRIRCLLLLFILPFRIWIPSILFVLFHLVTNVLLLRVVLSGADRLGTAVLAHLGGFGVGFFYVQKFRRFIGPPKGPSMFP